MGHRVKAPLYPDKVVDDALAHCNGALNNSFKFYIALKVFGQRTFAKGLSNFALLSDRHIIILGPEMNEIWVFNFFI